MSLPSVLNLDHGNENCFHSGPAVKFWIAGICPALASVWTATAYVFPSPLAQNESVFLPERFAESSGEEPGKKSTPAKANPDPGTISPETCSAPFVSAAPPATAEIAACDLPPLSA